MNARKILIYLSIINNGDYDKTLQMIREKKIDFPDEEVEKVVSNIKANVLTLLDSNYPQYLKQLTMPPIVLFYYGDISLINNYENNVAIIGTRNPTEYGKKYIKKFTKDFAETQNIVSGLALGTQTIAHETALEEGKKTIAVLGSGIDSPYPSQNKKLYDDIINNGGLVISEYPNDTMPSMENFPKRNRLIAMFSKTMVVGEATQKSGTAIATQYALMYDREVLCLPTQLDSEFNFGNTLINEGAGMLLNA